MKIKGMVFILILGFSVVTPAVLRHQLICDSKGRLIKSQLEGADTGGKEKDQKIFLGDPVDAYYSNRQGNYSSEKIKNVIQMAVQYGMDPYYVLSTILMENPSAIQIFPATQPNILDERSYEKRYGLVPMDMIASLDAFHCQVQEIPFPDQKEGRAAQFLLKDFNGNQALYEETKKMDQQKSRDPKRQKEWDQRKQDLLARMLAQAEQSLANQKADMRDLNYRKWVSARYICSQNLFEELRSSSFCRGLVLPPKDVVVYNLGEGKEVKVCQPAVLAPPGEPVNISFEESFDKDPHIRNFEMGCCAKIKASSTAKPQDLLQQLRGVMGFDFLKSKLATGQSVTQSLQVTDKTQKMALVLQAFNGYGNVGVALGEKANTCLNGLNLKKNPVYGAGVAELTLNVLMANADIRKMVETASSQKSVRSVFCEVLGEGSHSFLSTDFAQIQKEAFAGRKCPPHSYEETPLSLGTPARETR